MRDSRGGNFEKTEVVDPARSGGVEVAVSAVLLSLTRPVILPPVSDSLILLLDGHLDVAALGEGEQTGPCRLTIRPPGEVGLLGSGEPVTTGATAGGQSTSPPHIEDGEIQGTMPNGGLSEFLRGDANDDARIDIADAVWIVNELFRLGPRTRCQDAADLNLDGMMDLSDALYILAYEFLHGAPPPPPFPRCGRRLFPTPLVCDAPGAACRGE